MAYHPILPPNCPLSSPSHGEDCSPACAKAGEQSSPWEGEERGQFGGRIGRIKEGVKHPQRPQKLCKTVQKRHLNSVDEHKKLFNDIKT